MLYVTVDLQIAPSLRRVIAYRDSDSRHIEHIASYRAFRELQARASEPDLYGEHATLHITEPVRQIAEGEIEASAEVTELCRQIVGLSLSVDNLHDLDTSDLMGV